LKLIGMIHLPPLPGSPGYTGLSLDDYLSYALGEADKLYRAGFDGLIIENYMDYPYRIRVVDETILSILASIVESIKKEYSGLLVGLNILRNSGVEAAKIICRYGGDFIRVNAYLEPVYAPEGYLEPIARDIWDVLVELDCRVKLYVDVNVKHSKPILDYETALYNTCSRGRVDGVIVTGWATGYETPPADVLVAKMICGDKEVWVGSGVTPDNIGLYIGLADAVIVGTSIKEEGITEKPIDYKRARLLVERVRVLEKRIKKQYRG